MIDEYAKILEKSKERNEFIVRQMKYLGKFNIKNFDHVVADYHDEVFAEIDCMQCGNCCRTVGPTFTETEVTRIAKIVGTNPRVFMRDSLVDVMDIGWMCRTMPCPFIESDNACSVYEDRPKACGAYPYTSGRNIQKALGRLARNTEYCPAAYMIAEKIILRYAKGTET